MKLSKIICKMNSCKSISGFVSLIEDQNITEINRDMIKEEYPDISDNLLDTLYYIFIESISKQAMYDYKKLLNCYISYKEFAILIYNLEKWYNNINEARQYFQNFDNFDELTEFLKINKFSHFCYIIKHRLNDTLQAKLLYIRISDFSFLIANTYSDKFHLCEDEGYIDSEYYTKLMTDNISDLGNYDDFYIIGGNPL